MSSRLDALAELYEQHSGSAFRLAYLLTGTPIRPRTSSRTRSSSSLAASPTSETPIPSMPICGRPL